MKGERPRFSLQLTLRDNQGYEQPMSMLLDLAHEVRISSRDVSDMKFGAGIGAALVPMTAAVQMMRVREIRKKLFVEAAMRLATQMAERMEDAEGWHDPSRIEAARKQLGGDWP